MFRNLKISNKASNQLKLKFPKGTIDLTNDKKEINSWFSTGYFNDFFLSMRSYEEMEMKIITKTKSRYPDVEEEVYDSSEGCWYYGRALNLMKNNHILLIRKFQSRQRINILLIILGNSDLEKMWQELKEYPILLEDCKVFENYCHVLSSN